FPFERLYAPNEMEFWRLVIANFLDTALLMLHGLVGDSGKNILSLASFRNAIVEGPWLDQNKPDILRETLRERRFDTVKKSILHRVDKIRDRIAHPLVDIQTGAPKEVLEGVSLEEMRQLFAAAHSLFGALSFGSAYATLAGDLMPCLIGGEPSR